MLPFAMAYDLTDFPTDVLERSQRTPVLVDFWAAWCAPCRMLMPVLSALAAEFEGRFELVKVDTDQEQELAAAYGVRSLPTVLVFRDGKPVDQFMGAQPESTIRALLERHLPRASDAALDQARALGLAGQPLEALAVVDGVLAHDPANPQAAVVRAGLLLELGRIEEMDAALAALPARARQEPEAASLSARAAFARLAATAPSPVEVAQRLESNPGDCRARLQSAAYRVMAGDHAGALEELLDAVRRDRRFDDDAGRRLLLALFDLLGAGHPLARAGRSRLASLLN